jgi:hypothetical protein
VAAACVDVLAAGVVVVRGRRDRNRAFVLVIVAVAILVAAFVVTGGHRLRG